MEYDELKYIGKISEFKSITDFETSLEKFLNSNSQFLSDGSIFFIKKRVDKICNLKIEIYPNEHGEPHFHVISNEFKAEFSIEDCNLKKGYLKPNEVRLIKYWFQKSKSKLIEVWDETRPTNCQVGKYKASNK